MYRRIVVCGIFFLGFLAMAHAQNTADANKMACKRFYSEVLNKGNVAVADELIAKDYIELAPAPGFSADLDGLKKWVTTFRTAFPDLKATIDDLIAEGDKVVIRFTMSGTQKGAFNGMPASGKSFSVSGVDIVRFANGKAVEHWGLTDDMAMMKQLGMMDKPEQAKK